MNILNWTQKPELKPALKYSTRTKPKIYKYFLCLNFFFPNTAGVKKNRPE